MISISSLVWQLGLQGTEVFGSGSVVCLSQSVAGLLFLSCGNHFS